MEITYLGHACFKLRGKSATVVTDPFDPDMVGVKFPKISANIVTVSHQHKDHNYSAGVSDREIVISGPGEYELKGIKILGVSTYHDSEGGKDRGKNTIYRIEIDRVSIVHLGDLGHKLNDKEVDRLDGVDVLLVPVGGEYTINSEEAAMVASQIEPKIIIPMHYNRPDLNQQNFAKLTGVETFLKEMGKTGVTPLPKLVVNRDKLPLETTVVVLE
ncbi:MBL fold metallo-hydrolase [Candidatus Gottesmanbacteria bacterium]|nr:MBL fold metallo-hydrolase [Candidatus Gottesmanbacteria bacterium]